WSSDVCSSDLILELSSCIGYSNNHTNPIHMNVHHQFHKERNMLIYLFLQNPNKQNFPLSLHPPLKLTFSTHPALSLLRDLLYVCLHNFVLLEEVTVRLALCLKIYSLMI